MTPLTPDEILFLRRAVEDRVYLLQAQANETKSKTSKERYKREIESLQTAFFKVTGETS